MVSSEALKVTNLGPLTVHDRCLFLQSAWRAMARHEFLDVMHLFQLPALQYFIHIHIAFQIMNIVVYSIERTCTRVRKLTQDSV